MKIEIGESLIYSWLRHVKECQIVQSNWKASPKWVFNHNAEIETMLNELDVYFSTQYGYKVFKKNVSLSQIIQQGECDVLGINVLDDENSNGVAYNYYAVDVAYHQKRLQYGTKYETTLKIIAKCIRTIFSLYGFFGAKSGEIIFASPKVGNNVYSLANPLFDYLNDYFTSKGFSFNIRFIYNESFEEKIIKPVVLVSKDVADTNELFMRSYQLADMFSNEDKEDDEKKKTKKSLKTLSKSSSKTSSKAPTSTTTIYDELRVGQIARTILKDVLKTKKLTDIAVINLQDKSYCRDILGVTVPVLVEEGNAFDRGRYYASPVEIESKKFYVTNDWYDRHRDKLIDWIEANK